MTIEKMLTQQVLEAVKACYGVELTEKDVQLQETRKEFSRLPDIPENRPKKRLKSWESI